MKHYQVTVIREGKWWRKWWMVHIPEIDGLTQARCLKDAPRMARESIAAALDLNPDDITVDVHVKS
ncbi:MULTISPECIES: hypothetical protein [unclassified Amycolatopsis]|uniref:hypothetical protein n=1 Tax=unclassified Amycolatopsis TaxID=2618356 RepID=UPI001C69DCDA|nr:hypothetical protein [Amycolatopsis sp. DSM 110486]QYN20355.1 hypothetical protein K1T34_48910 [Amycolatopsis sp. DSM 110486]